MKLSTYQAIKNAADEKEKARQRAHGALDAAMAKLKEDFDCSTLKEARVKLAEWQAEENKIRTELEARMAKFNNKWQTLLGETND